MPYTYYLRIPVVCTIWRRVVMFQNVLQHHMLNCLQLTKPFIRSLDAFAILRMPMKLISELRYPKNLIPWLLEIRRRSISIYGIGPALRVILGGNIGIYFAMTVLIAVTRK